MRIRRVREVVPEPVVTGVAVCYCAEEGRFAVRHMARWMLPTGEWATERVAYPLSRRELVRDSGGPELADFLMEHPGYWWRMPLPVRAEEDGAL